MRHRTEDYIPRCGDGMFAEVAALEALVDDFADAMEAKLIEKFREQRGGWDDLAWPVEEIRVRTLEHVHKGDPVDVANLAAFWWNRIGGPQREKVGG